MSQTRRSSSVIMIFMLVSGLIVLWRRGRDDLDAWGQRSPSNSYRIVRPRQASQPGGHKPAVREGSDIAGREVVEAGTRQDERQRVPRQHRQPATGTSRTRRWRRSPPGDPAAGGGSRRTWPRGRYRPRHTAGKLTGQAPRSVRHNQFHFFRTDCGYPARESQPQTRIRRARTESAPSTSCCRRGR
jgi:hypothetical protein